MILVVAEVRVRPGKAEAYEALCREMMAKVRASAPGVLFYQLGKSRDAPDTYRMIEAYADEAAMRAHLGSALLADVKDVAADCIADINVRVHDAIV